jgi:hypothetical protein
MCPKILNCARLSSVSARGLSLLATQTVVRTGILLNHIVSNMPGKRR